MRSYHTIYKPLHGRYKWYPALQVVDYYSNYSTSYTDTIQLTEAENTQVWAITRAKEHSREIIKRRVYEKVSDSSTGSSSD